MPTPHIITATRTPLGRFGGSLASLSPIDLGAQVIQSVLKQAGIPAEAIDCYIFGNVLRAGHGQHIPRQAALKAGIPAQVNGYAIDMVCSSGMMSLLNAAMMIQMGQADLVLAGGIESMSQAGFFLSHRARWGYKTLLGAPEPLSDILLVDGLTDATQGEGMGEQAERLTALYGFSREALDEVAFQSHQRATIAREKGSFQREISPVTVQVKQKTQTIDQDEGIRSDTTREALAKLRPAFHAEGVLTAGNSSQLTDGAAMLLLASETAIDRYGLKPIAKVIGGTMTGGESWRFPEVPVWAVKKLLEQIGMTVTDIDLFENNEAFAVSNLLFHHLLNIAPEQLNVNGGAIALGHPIGASGARIVVTLLNALQERDRQFGIASICHGTGGGTAIGVEQSHDRFQSIAIDRYGLKTIVALLHPGTTDTRLSQPFQRNVPPEKLFSVDRTVSQLLAVINSLQIENSGQFFSWDGSELPW
ncbi:acetyl-CoA C-acyltransferase [Leptolyngbya ohadii]|uniref:acetyl-CoA C-acyltransferase n=1 Tax=Leptolyngbya ohadii TaxID=1962290 RepID=UPI000B59CA2F|nr:acetyl-CoA C-acyltransferase [Leptolyngbya ohadii]